MPAPISIARTHVHSMRLRNGAEALVARVLTVDGATGFGFTLNFEAVVAREMAAWDALARARKVPFHALFGTKTRERVEIAMAEADAIDPFDGAPIEEMRRRAAGLERVALLAPNSHSWEIAHCTALAATLSGSVRIAVRHEPSAKFAVVSDALGVDIEWSLEPGFGRLRWLER